MKSSEVSIFFVCIGFLCAGCSSKSWNSVGVGLASGAVGAAVGYTLLHHGQKREYQTTNTIISGSVFAALGSALTYWHLTSLENQKMELAGHFSRSIFLDSDSTKATKGGWLVGAKKGQNSIRLDDSTRWVFPEFLKRELPSQQGETELISSHYAWEIARPGFFLTRDQDPTLFSEEEHHESK